VVEAQSKEMVARGDDRVVGSPPSLKDIRLIDPFYGCGTFLIVIPLFKDILNARRRLNRLVQE
jgi:hypothetical protein